MPFLNHVAMAMRPQNAFKWLKIAPFSQQSAPAKQVY